MNNLEIQKDSDMTRGEDVPAPTVKHELVVMRCPNPRAISVCIATNRAYQWLKLCDCYFVDWPSIMLGNGKNLPTVTTLVIPECYDFEEVFNYISNKPWAVKM